jgi:glycosyltransferase involved in cell wall biosynthesis
MALSDADCFPCRGEQDDARGGAPVPCRTGLDQPHQAQDVSGMAHGLPVIASNLPIVEELLGESRAAVLFENGNIAELAERMVGMATSTDLAERGRIAMDYAREFSINNIIKEWKEIIER